MPLREGTNINRWVRTIELSLVRYMLEIRIFIALSISIKLQFIASMWRRDSWCHFEINVGRYEYWAPLSLNLILALMIQRNDLHKGVWKAFASPLIMLRWRKCRKFNIYTSLSFDRVYILICVIRKLQSLRALIASQRNRVSNVTQFGAHSSLRLNRQCTDLCW